MAVTLQRVKIEYTKIMRLFLYLIILSLLSCSLPADLMGEQSTPTSSDSATIQPEKSIPSLLETGEKYESWYFLLLKGEKVGSMNTIFSSLTSTSQTNLSIQKSYSFLREISLSRATPLPYLKLIEEVQVSADNWMFQKIDLRLSLIDKREIIFNGVKDENEVKISMIANSISSSGEPISDTIAEEFTYKENLYSDQSFGISLIKNEWVVNQSYPLRFISPYNLGKFFADAHLMIKEKTLQKIMGVPTEGYLCSLIILDPAASVKEIEYFIGLNGAILKQTIGDITIIKVTREEFTVGVISSKGSFDRRGRPDPFTMKLTVLKKEKDGPPPPPPPISPTSNTSTLIKEAEGQLKLMKEIYEKSPKEERDKLLATPYQKILDIYDKVNESDNTTAKNKMLSIREQAERFFVEILEKIYAEACYVRDESQKDFNLKNFKDIPKKLSKISELADRKEIKNTVYLLKVIGLRDEVVELARRAKIIEEFFSVKPVINGIIYYIKSEEVKLPPLIMHFLGSEISLPVSYFKEIPASTVIIATKTYKEGDKISDDLIVTTILPTAIVFNYKNEEISVEYKGK